MIQGAIQGFVYGLSYGIRYGGTEKLTIQNEMEISVTGEEAPVSESTSSGGSVGNAPASTNTSNVLDEVAAGSKAKPGPSLKIDPYSVDRIWEGCSARATRACAGFSDFVKYNRCVTDWTRACLRVNGL
jgi:hypothetical protein